nr:MULTISPECIES: hypothetical protein [unclassified Streptomyces]
MEENRRRQQELAETLRMLRQEEALLVDILELAERYEGLSDPSPLPEQAQEEPSLAGSVSHRAPAASSSAVAPSRRPTGTGRTARTAAKGTSRPLLGDLLLSLLGGHEEPRLAKELRDELMALHPDRAPTPQVVRNALESLVAKGLVQRHKQQRSVMYTAAEPGRRAPAGGRG